MLNAVVYRFIRLLCSLSAKMALVIFHLEGQAQGEQVNRVKEQAIYKLGEVYAKLGCSPLPLLSLSLSKASPHCHY